MTDDDPISDIPDSVFDYPVENYYDLLKVNRRSAHREVKRAYREMVQEFHPDRSDHEHAEEVTFALNQAKQVLLDQNERVRYNEVGHDQYYAESLTNMETVDQQFNLENEESNTSIYELIMMTKLNDYTEEAWWKTVLKSTGFKIVISVIGFLTFITVLFVLL